MVDKSEAWLDGWFAHKKQADVHTENPYNAKTQARSHHQWDAGWCARFQAEKHGTWYHGQEQFSYDNALFED